MNRLLRLLTSLRSAKGALPVLAVAAAIALSVVGSPLNAFDTVFSYAACTSASLSAAPPQPQHEGTTVDLTAGSTGCTSPEYKFFLQPPGLAWTPVTTYGGQAFAWSTTHDQGGVWGIGVWVRQMGHAAAYEAYYLGTYTIESNCTSANLTPAPPAPRQRGTTIDITGSSTGCRNPEYRFWILTRNGTHWSSFGPYSTSTTATWNTTNYPAGPWRVGVWARQIGSSHGYDSYSIVTFQIT